MVADYLLTSADDSPERDSKNGPCRVDRRRHLDHPGHPGGPVVRRAQLREHLRDRQHHRVPVLPTRHLRRRQWGHRPVSPRSLCLTAPPRPIPECRSRPAAAPPRLRMRRRPRSDSPEWLSLRGYSGSTTSEGGGHHWQKLPTSISPSPRTPSSATAFSPEFGGDQSYASTNTAIDLAFTDGTYLSELGAQDQYRFDSSPAGQGESKALFTDQWNQRTLRLGEVAEGKTIDRSPARLRRPRRARRIRRLDRRHRDRRTTGPERGASLGLGRHPPAGPIPPAPTRAGTICPPPWCRTASPSGPRSRTPAH